MKELATSCVHLHFIFEELSFWFLTPWGLASGVKLLGATCCYLPVEDTNISFEMFTSICVLLWAGIAQSVYILATGWTVRRSSPGGGEVFRTGPDRPWGQHSLLYNGYCVPFPGAKLPGRGVSHPPPSSAEVKERVELYLYSLSGLLWPVLGQIYFTFMCFVIAFLGCDAV